MGALGWNRGYGAGARNSLTGRPASPIMGLFGGKMWRGAPWGRGATVGVFGGVMIPLAAPSSSYARVGSCASGLMVRQHAGQKSSRSSPIEQRTHVRSLSDISRRLSITMSTSQRSQRKWTISVIGDSSARELVRVFDPVNSNTVHAQPYRSVRALQHRQAATSAEHDRAFPFAP